MTIVPPAEVPLIESRRWVQAQCERLWHSADITSNADWVVMPGSTKDTGIPSAIKAVTADLLNLMRLTPDAMDHIAHMNPFSVEDHPQALLVDPQYKVAHPPREYSNTIEMFAFPNGCIARRFSAKFSEGMRPQLVINAPTFALWQETRTLFVPA